MIESSRMFGVPSAACRVQPLRSIGLLVLLKSSIHSSAAFACVPDQATSLMTTESGAAGELVRVGVRLGVKVLVEGGVRVLVAVRVDNNHSQG